MVTALPPSAEEPPALGVPEDFEDEQADRASAADRPTAARVRERFIAIPALKVRVENRYEEDRLSTSTRVKDSD